MLVGGGGINSEKTAALTGSTENADELTRVGAIIELDHRFPEVCGRVFDPSTTTSLKPLGLAVLMAEEESLVPLTSISSRPTVQSKESSSSRPETNGGKVLNGGADPMELPKCN